MARNIVAGLEGRPDEHFRYVDRGSMATIGRHAAVAQLPGGIRLRGTVGWLSWLFLHLVMLVGLPQPGERVGQLGVELPHL